MTKQGRVIRIFDDAKVAINLGAQDGMHVGKHVYIFAPVVDIQDPETDESLGTYRLLKAEARITNTSERFSIIGPFPVHERVADPRRSPIWPTGRTPTRTRDGELPIDSAQAVPVPTGNEIRVGDTIEVEVDDPEPEASVEPQSDATAEPAPADSRGSEDDG